LDTQEKTALANVICVGKTEFPKRRMDIDQIKQIQFESLAEFEQNQKMLEFQIQKMRKELLSIQKIANETVSETFGVEIFNLDANSNISRIITDSLNHTVVSFLKLFHNIRSDSDITTISLLDGKIQRQILTLLDLINDPLENPFSQIPWEKENDFDPTISENIRPQVVMSEQDGEQMLMIQFFSENEKPILPIVLRKAEGFSYWNSYQDNFYEITVWDVSLAVLWTLLGLLTAVPSIVDHYSDKKFRKKLLSLRRNDTFSVRKMSLVRPPRRTMKKGKNTRISENPTPFHKNYIGDIPMTDLQRKNKKVARRGETTTYVISNDDLPLHLADSNLSLF
jgi:hypothetical protein